MEFVGYNSSMIKKDLIVSFDDAEKDSKVSLRTTEIKDVVLLAHGQFRISFNVNELQEALDELVLFIAQNELTEELSQMDDDELEDPHAFVVEFAQAINNIKAPDVPPSDSL